MRGFTSVQKKTEFLDDTEVKPKVQQTYHIIYFCDDERWYYMYDAYSGVFSGLFFFH